ncbi:hypothetical protein ANME2D_00617 [Candidatus Methanoperedens nitroreducens]|uniref:PDGLE domain-containing protein n=1 Tax=Candidatus Methanoperedens nitratireducens TaxID=1392998 RepID=A0A062V8C9_9EURY|nr:PDGLE domain-containing protein [Candidatus Methanoperedens nitroreducens]KCZ73547.1 hypothetical protein ANME2D_00617 [Candidatus Methanoperedens nitroreducens]MDJ1422493.1 PDGLE domain-containing protein [Candidatus Methanoperedens sp.]
MNGKTMKKLWIGIAILIALTPLGLLASGMAWGEWSSEELQEMLGYVPDGINKGENLWQSLFPGYSISGLEDSFLQSGIGYILSAVIGIGLIYLVTIALGKFIAKREEEKGNENS